MTDMKTKQSSRRTYMAPGMSVKPIELELDFLSSTANAGQLNDMDPNELYDESF